MRHRYGMGSYLPFVRTVAETPIFSRYAAVVWTEAEREAFVAWIAAHPHRDHEYGARRVAGRVRGAPEAGDRR